MSNQDSWEDFLDSELTALGMSDKKTIERVKWYYQTYFKAQKYNHVLEVLRENYEAAKRLTDEDKERPAQEMIIETYEDLISIFEKPQQQNT